MFYSKNDVLKAVWDPLTSTNNTRFLEGGKGRVEVTTLGKLRMESRAVMSTV